MKELTVPVLEPARIIMNPGDKYDESNRLWQGCPTITLTRGGRLYAGWYSGGDQEPHIENYNLLVYSDDDGKTWSKPIMIIESVKENLIHALDIQLWTDPDGRVWIFWVQERFNSKNVDESPQVFTGSDKIHGVWAIHSNNPDDDNPVWSKPKRYDDGFLRCQPTALKDGSWFMCNYDHNTSQYGYSISKDKGNTWVRHYGAKKITTPFDETMVVERLDGSIWMLARTLITKTYLAQTFLYNGGKTWTPTGLSTIQNPSTRFWIGRLPSSRLLLINNDDTKLRKNMTAFLSDDDGATWKYSLMLDDRYETSYPDVALYPDGRICVIYDYNRNSDKEILLSVITENDIINGKISNTKIFQNTISKAPLRDGDIEKVNEIRENVAKWLRSFNEE